MARQGLEQLNALMEHPVPAIPIRVFEWSFPVDRPLLRPDEGAVLAEEESRQGLLKAATEQGTGSSFFLPPAVEIPIAVQAGAAQVVIELCEAIRHRHRCSPPPARTV